MAIVTTAHLSDEERQFVTTLVLSKLVTWMRRQSGTTDLRALLYMDEVAGYLPPTANPRPSKPIMTLMKQARAFGVGVVLSTQNPVDIDYKAISNAGTWMIGRLQTDRDKQRLLDGMSAASGGVDVQAVGDTISGLAKRGSCCGARQGPAGHLHHPMGDELPPRPLTRDQIEVLMADARRKTAAAPVPTAAAPAAPSAPAAAAAPAPDRAGSTGRRPSPAATPLGQDETAVLPDVASGIPVAYLDPAAAWASGSAPEPALGTRPPSSPASSCATTRPRPTRPRRGVRGGAVPAASLPDPRQAVAVDYDDRDLARAHRPGSSTPCPPLR